MKRIFGAGSVLVLGMAIGCGSAEDEGAADETSSSSSSSGVNAPGSGSNGGGASGAASSTSGSSGSGTFSSGGSGSSSSSSGNPSSSSGGPNGSSGDPGVGGSPLALPSCTDAGRSTVTLPTGVSFDAYVTSEPGPLMPRGARTHLFLDGSFWSVGEGGTMATHALPDVLLGATHFTPQRSASGYSSILFSKGGSWFVSAYDDLRVSPAVALPVGTGTVEARVAGDGHHWIRQGEVFHEQTATVFVNRGSGPAGGTWDVLADGTVVLVTFPSSGSTEIVVWSLLPGAVAWTERASLRAAEVADIAAGVEGGFDPATAAIAPDGSVHVFTNARCIGEGQRNRQQAYARLEGTVWHVERLPPIDELTAGLLTWNQPAVWAGDREHVRFVYTSSLAPTFDGWSYVYPERNYDVVSRCRTEAGELSFARIGRVRHPGWTQRGFASFSETGVATLLTKSLGLTQVW